VFFWTSKACPFHRYRRGERSGYPVRIQHAESRRDLRLQPRSARPAEQSWVHVGGTTDAAAASGPHRGQRGTAPQDRPPVGDEGQPAALQARAEAARPQRADGEVHRRAVRLHRRCADLHHAGDHHAQRACQPAGVRTAGSRRAARGHRAAHDDARSRPHDAA